MGPCLVRQGREFCSGLTLWLCGQGRSGRSLHWTLTFFRERFLARQESGLHNQYRGGHARSRSHTNQGIKRKMFHPSTAEVIYDGRGHL